MNFKSFLNTKDIIILDGAMGTELDKRGIMGRCENNLIHPNAVIDIHREYFNAGSHVAITNTLTINRIFIESHRLAIDVAEVNRSAAKLARTAADGKGYVLGNLGSIGQMLEPFGTYTELDVIDVFKEQASNLIEGGIDGFIIETMFDLREAVCALKACKSISILPVMVSIAFNTEQNGGRTIMGNSARECAICLTNEGADVIGTNCGNIDPDQMAQIIFIFASSTKLPIYAEPNAGKPKLINGATVFDMDPDTFSRGLLTCARACALILGGCCGTSPAHIRALSKALKSESFRNTFSV